jgi:hypothetical protein
MNQFRRIPCGLVPLLPPAVLAAVYEPAALLLAAPWLLGLAWVLARPGPALRDAPSPADEARRRLAVR